jgi:hypothetical protein
MGVKAYPKTYASVFRVFASGALFALGTHALAQSDPLHSWNDGAATKLPPAAAPAK